MSKEQARSRDFQCKAHLHRPGRGDVYLELEEKNSLAQFAVIEITREAFADLILSNGDVECVVTLRGLQNLGRKHAHKTELVPFDCWGSKKFTEAEEREIIEPYTEGGKWEAHFREGHCVDLHNGHRRKELPDGSPAQEVTFFGFDADPA